MTSTHCRVTYRSVDWMFLLCVIIGQSLSHKDGNHRSDERVQGYHLCFKTTKISFKQELNMVVLEPGGAFCIPEKMQNRYPYFAFVKKCKMRPHLER